MQSECHQKTVARGAPLGALEKRNDTTNVKHRLEFRFVRQTCSYKGTLLKAARTLNQTQAAFKSMTDTGKAGASPVSLGFHPNRLMSLARCKCRTAVHDLLRSHSRGQRHWQSAVASLYHCLSKKGKLQGVSGG
jgi:hypothetical protein